MQRRGGNEQLRKSVPTAPPCARLLEASRQTDRSAASPVMAPDIAHLLAFLQAPAFRYRDLHSRVASVSPPRRTTSRDRLTILALVSLVKGVGRTTLAALLAGRLARRGVRAVALDLDPLGQLSEHFRGRARLDLPLDEQSVVEWLAPRCGYVPFGHDPASVIALGNCDVLLLDTPAGASIQIEQVLVEADEVLIVARPDRTSLEALKATEELLSRPLLRSWRSSRARYLVNGFDGRRALDRDALALLRHSLGARLLSRPVQADEAIPAAIATGLRLEDLAPQSQVIPDLDAALDELFPAGKAH
jgi:cellulose biosynthesis protein BcsQ